jgi:hypothetical protein
MANHSLLSCLEKRDLLNQPAASVDSLMAWGDRFLEAGCVHDAVDFYAKAGAQEALVRLLALAREEGDVFLLRRICALLGREPTAEEWLAAAEQAERLGKDLFAAKGYQAAGAQDRSDALRERTAR